MALVKKGPFLWLFIAIKFELSLVMTFIVFVTAYKPCKTKSGIKLLIFATEQKLKVHWNGIQKIFLLGYY